jgi:hypothetical protein
MRRTILISTVVLCASTAAMALPGRALVGDAEFGVAGPTIHQGQIAPAGFMGSSQPGFTRGNVILAKGDQSGTGPGAGGHKGKKLGEGKGGQPESKMAKGKGGQPSGQMGKEPRGGPAQPRR